MPYLRASSTDQRSAPIGSNQRVSSVQVNEARLDLARKIAGVKCDFASTLCSRHQPSGTSWCRKTDFPSSMVSQSKDLTGNRIAPRTFSGRREVETVCKALSTSSARLNSLPPCANSANRTCRSSEDLARAWLIANCVMGRLEAVVAPANYAAPDRGGATSGKTPTPAAGDFTPLADVFLDCWVRTSPWRRTTVPMQPVRR